MLAIICGFICAPDTANAEPPPTLADVKERIVQHIPEITPEPTLPYTEPELDELARLIAVEAGSTWIPDTIQRYVASVVINRVNHPYFPNTIHDVIYQNGQYGPVMRGDFENAIPDKRTIENAKYVLTYGSVLPADVVFQDNYEQGDGIFFIYNDDYLGKTYFCYLNN